MALLSPTRRSRMQASSAPPLTPQGMNLLWSKAVRLPCASPQAGCAAPAWCHTDQSTSSGAGLAQAGGYEHRAAQTIPSSSCSLHALFWFSQPGTRSNRRKSGCEAPCGTASPTGMAAGCGEQQAATAAEIFKTILTRFCPKTEQLIYFNNRCFLGYPRKQRSH